MENKKGIEFIEDIDSLGDLERTILKEEMRKDGMAYDPSSDIRLDPERLAYYKECLDRFRKIETDPEAFWSKVKRIDDKLLEMVKMFVKRISIPEGYDEIGSLTFDGARNLREVELPKTVKVIRSSAFNKCRELREINLDEIEYIENRAFLGCRRLKKVYLPKIEHIEPYAFKDCNDIEEVYLPKSFKQDVDEVFQSKNLAKVVYLDDVPNEEKTTHQSQPGEE